MKAKFPKKVRCRWCYPETILTVNSEQEIIDHMRAHDATYSTSKTVGVEYIGKGFKAIVDFGDRVKIVHAYCCYVISTKHIPHKTHIGLVQQQVLELLADGKVHKTNEFPLGPDTSHGSWKNRPFEYRHMNFDRQRKLGNIERVSKRRANAKYPEYPMAPLVAEWKITEKGLRRLQDK